MKKVYPYWWTLAFCYTNNYDKIIENIIASFIDTKYYWRKNQKEIDFLVVNNKKRFIPIEVKNKKELTKRDLKNMKYFLEDFKIKEGLIIYNGEEDEIKVNKSKIKLVHLWEWLLEHK